MGNIEIIKGDTLVINVTLYESDGVTPRNLTGKTYAAKLRSNPAATGAPDATFTQAVVSAPAGTMTLTLDNTVTDTLSPSLTYYFDLEETNGSVITTVLRRSLTVVQDVTHA